VAAEKKGRKISLIVKIEAKAFSGSK